ncbi:MAG: hypothetical protein AB8B55_07595 [Mariniblastus sp.]
MSTKKPKLEAFCRTQAIEDFRALLGEISNLVPEGDRRKNVRTTRTLVLAIQPLDEKLNPVGRPFNANTRNVSQRGIGFLHSAEFFTPYVRIGPTAHSITQTIARVCYNKPLYGEEKMFMIGVEFIDS